MSKKIKNKIVAVDFGATFIKFAIVNLNGKILKKDFIVTKEYKGSLNLIQKIAETVKLLVGKERSSFLGLGIGVPGPVDYKKGIVYNLTNVKGFKDIPLKSILGKKTGLLSVVDNDANAAALGEAEWGAAKGFKDIVCITLGSGVGGGVIMDGELFRGRGYSAAELGHICIDKKGPKCNCKSNGCIEVFAGNSYIVKDTIKRLKSKNTPLILKLANNKYSNITPEIISKAAKRGDKLAINIWKEVGSNVGIGLASVVNVLNPQIIVIGGGLSKAGSVLFNSIINTTKKRAFDIFSKDLLIKRAKFIEDAGTVGAGALVKRENKE